MTRRQLRWFIASATLATLGVPALVRGEDSANAERIFELTYTATVRNIPQSAQKALLWIPVPPSVAYQTLLGFEVQSGHAHESLIEPKFGNRFLRFDLRGSRESRIQVAYRIHRKAYRVLDREIAETVSAEDLTRFLGPNALVPIGGPIAREAAAVARNLKGGLPQARALYDNIVDTMRYDKSGEGWGRGDALYACDTRAGNCTDFHSLYIGQARSLKIPARFLIGFPLPPDETSGSIDGYHCWAEFHLDGLGWAPLDASEAQKYPDLRKALFGGLDANRAHFTIGRDYRLPGSETGPVNYAIYPHVEVNGRLHTDVESAFSFRDIESD